MSRAYKPEDAMLRPAKESTLERQQKMRQDKKKPPNHIGMACLSLKQMMENRV